MVKFKSYKTLLGTGVLIAACVTAALVWSSYTKRARCRQVLETIQQADRFVYGGVEFASDSPHFAGMSDALIEIAKSPTKWSFNPDRIDIVSCVNRDGDVIQVELCEDAIVIDGIAFRGNGEVVRARFERAWRDTRKDKANMRPVR